MRRIGYILSYLADMHVRIVHGCWLVIRSAWTRRRLARPCIVEYQMRCRSDFEIALFASSITIPPGTLVVGIAAGRGDERPSIFVHSAYDNDRASVDADLRELETRVLLATRGKV